MTEKERILMKSEEFVRELSKKMNQNLHEKSLKKVAKKVSKTIPLSSRKVAAV
jgi:hypothetical protein